MLLILRWNKKCYSNFLILGKVDLCFKWDESLRWQLARIKLPWIDHITQRKRMPTQTCKGGVWASGNGGGGKPIHLASYQRSRLARPNQSFLHSTGFKTCGQRMFVLRLHPADTYHYRNIGSWIGRVTNQIDGGRTDAPPHSVHVLLAYWSSTAMPPRTHTRPHQRPSAPSSYRRLLVCRQWAISD